jgi:hypothetical protein
MAKEKIRMNFGKSDRAPNLYGIARAAQALAPRVALSFLSKFKFYGDTVNFLYIERRKIGGYLKNLEG